MKFIILVSTLKEISPIAFSPEYIKKNYDGILLSKYDSVEKRYKLFTLLSVDMEILTPRSSKVHPEAQP